MPNKSANVSFIPVQPEGPETDFNDVFNIGFRKRSRRGTFGHMIGREPASLNTRYTKKKA